MDMQYGFQAFQGMVWCNQWVDTYNRYTKLIDQQERKDPLKRGALCNQEIEFYKDQRHRHFVQCMSIK